MKISMAGLSWVFFSVFHYIKKELVYDKDRSKCSGKRTGYLTTYK